MIGWYELYLDLVTSGHCTQCVVSAPALTTGQSATHWPIVTRTDQWWTGQTNHTHTLLVSWVPGGQSANQSPTLGWSAVSQPMTGLHTHTLITSTTEQRIDTELSTNNQPLHVATTRPVLLYLISTSIGICTEIENDKTSTPLQYSSA